MTNRTQEFYTQITDKIISLVETSGKDWVLPFTRTAQKNAVSGKVYRGINTIILALESPATTFASYKQWQELGYQVKKGEKSHTCKIFK